ncbi:type II secretion system F family protein [Pseudomonas sp. MYb185]|uniref:type II secretion system F family protein n=1 Tax=Pseudomonas sp. MYb185 TaxID=1848729 RepID=UPI000CFB6D29|nr:type II secretion system F family protein [Pseudomonas sp. MYb185]PRB83821.1 type II secretion system protein F [Pseudomonas sp. MYb185]
MNIALLLCLLLLIGGVLLLRRGLRDAQSEQVMQRLAQGQALPERVRMGTLQRELLRSGLRMPSWLAVLLLGVWSLVAALTALLGGWLALLVVLLVPPVLLRMYMLWQYGRRLQRMVGQMPQFLDHVVRSLKSGRTLGDGMLLSMQSCQQPLHGAMERTHNAVQRGMPLAEAMQDFAELYERDEFHILAMGVAVNQRYGGNASELLTNLIGMIRDRERAARQLRALTGETRISALVLGCLPLAMGGYIFLSNPQMLLNMWEQSGGRMVLLVAFGLQVVGSWLLWRMMRSITK